MLTFQLAFNKAIFLFAPIMCIYGIKSTYIVNSLNALEKQQEHERNKISLKNM